MSQRSLPLDIQSPVGGQPLIKMQLNFDAEKLIAQIKPREAIWNYRCQAYNDKDLRRHEWTAVCKEMAPGFEKKTPAAKQAIVTSFQKQWKVLRDGFLRSLKNIQKKGSFVKPYTYHDDLLFMSELYEHDLDIDRKRKSADSGEATSEIETASADMPVIKRKYKRKRRRVPDTKPENKKTPTPKEGIIEKITKYIGNEERAKQNVENDEDKLFLLSLLTDFKRVPEALKLDAKFDILNVLRHYRNNGRQSEATSSKLSRISPAGSTTKASTEICYVKCEDADEFEVE